MRTSDACVLRMCQQLSRPFLFATAELAPTHDSKTQSTRAKKKPKRLQIDKSWTERGAVEHMNIALEIRDCCASHREVQHCSAFSPYSRPLTRPANFCMMLGKMGATSTH
jgi:hypothetical protein